MILVTFIPMQIGNALAGLQLFVDLFSTRCPWWARAGATEEPEKESKQHE